ncbi:hypothetical protein MKX01_036088 [Papaver californicum]|nr:hypothetical protein MKX01_036088 [Papaver californicum]
MDHWVEKRVLCSENEQLVLLIKKKRQEMAETPNGISENIDSTLYKAYRNLCDTKTPVKTLSELKKIKGVGHWILKLCQDFFMKDTSSAEPEECSQKGKKSKGKRRYLPQKNSARTSDGTEFMRKQELIDAAEASGLSRALIMPERGKGKPIQGGNSGNQWYTAWSCMGVLITKGLVVKSSNPAKYMLTRKVWKLPSSAYQEPSLCLDVHNLSNEEVTLVSSSQENSFAVDEVCKKFLDMGYSREDIQIAFTKASQVSQKQDILSLQFAILHLLEKVQVDELLSECRQTMGKVCHPSSSTCIVEDMGVARVPYYSCRVDSAPSSLALQACSSHKPFSFGGRDANMNALMMPPLKFGERFKDIYNVILILDDREHFTKHKNGDVELKKLIYLVEGDPNLIEAAEAIKTACFTTEILEGFDVHRTTGLADTLRRYGYLTQAISQYYREKVCNDTKENSGTCLPVNEFIKKCEDLEKVTVSDVFGIQLMQVPQVTEEIALSVLDLYPTVLSLARAYSVLEGNVEAQEEMLKRQSNNLISGPASRNMYYLIWGD